MVLRYCIYYLVGKGDGKGNLHSSTHFFFPLFYWMWNQLRQAPLVRSVGAFPERNNTEEMIFSQSGCHLPVEAQMWQSLREKLYCILTACFLFQLKSSSCPVATSTTATDDLICWHQRAFLSAFHAI